MYESQKPVVKNMRVDLMVSIQGGTKFVLSFSFGQDGAIER